MKKYLEIENFIKDEKRWLSERGKTFKKDILKEVLSRAPPKSWTIGKPVGSHAERILRMHE